MCAYIQINKKVTLYIEGDIASFFHFPVSRFWGKNKSLVLLFHTVQEEVGGEERHDFGS